MSTPDPTDDLAQRRARIEEILDRIDASTVTTMEEFDALEYDESACCGDRRRDFASTDIDIHPASRI